VILVFWAPVALLGAFLYWRLLALSAGLPPDLREGSNDLEIYRRAGEAVLRGEVPYRNFFLEYPPGSLPAFVPPALLSSGKAGYISAFSSEMALVLVATLALTALTARRIWGAWITPAATIAAGAILLYPVAVTRYDAVVALSLAGAAFCTMLGRGHLVLAYASLGLGAAAKLAPALATLPLSAFQRGAARGYAIFFAVLAIFFAPALLLGGGGFAGSFAYHADRGLQAESLATSVLMQVGQVSGVLFEYGAFEAQGRGVELASDLSLPVTGVLLLATAFFMYRARRRGTAGQRAFPRYAAALILAFMLGSKVLSPQYVVWLLPLLPLSAGGALGLVLSALFLATCYLTTQVFPVHYDDLLNLRFPGPHLLLARNLLLVLLWGLLLFLPGDAPEKRAA
jgi:glycosyl transferase family 87